MQYLFLQGNCLDIAESANLKLCMHAWCRTPTCSEVAAMVRRIEGWKEGKVKVTEETKVNGGW